MTQAWIPNPIEWHASWDYVKLAGQLFPFPCVVTGFDRDYTWDKKGGKGSKGETSTFTKQPLVDGEIEFKLWLPQHYIDWPYYRKFLKYDPTKTNPQAIAIYHPVPAMSEIFSVVTEKIGAPVYKGGGMALVKCKFSEYGPPPPKDASKDAKGTNTDGGGRTIRTPPGPPGKTDDPVSDANQKRIQDLLNKAKKL